MISSICPHCQNPFESSKPKKFCSMKCYTSSDEFKTRIAKNMAAGREKGRGPKRQGEYRPCAVCEKEIYMNATNIKRNKKTCSRLCYRKFMAERFDRHIGHIENLTDLSNYDEFLSQPTLKCLIAGCSWEGHNLTLHMNLSHGIKEEEFKRAAGFNLTTGVVSSAMQENLVARGNTGNRVYSEKARAARKFDYVSRESKEHRAKALILQNRNVKGMFSNIS